MTQSSSPHTPPAFSLKKFPYFILLSATWHYVGAKRRRYVCGLAMMTVALFIWLLEPFIMGQLFNVIQSGLETDAAIRKALVIVFLYFLLQPVGWLLHGPGRVIEREAAYDARRNFVQDMYRKLQHIPYSWHQDFHSGQLFDRIRKAESALETFASHQFQYIGMVMSFFGPIIALTFIFHTFGLACIAFTAVALVVILKYDRLLVPLYKESNRLSHDYAGVFSDYVANIRTVITLRLGSQTEKELLNRYEMRKPFQWKEYRLNEWKWTTIDQIAALLIACLIAVALLSVHSGGALKIGSLVMLIQYLAKFSGALFNMGWMYQEVVKSGADYTSCAIIDDAYQKHLVNLPDVPDHLQKNWHLIKLQNLSFAYENNQSRAQAVHDISLTISQGEKIALVGSSGSGKSSLMALLRALYRADAGQIVIDDKTFPPNILASLTTLIPQDPEIFENTIRYNITFGVEHTDAEIMDSCRIAGFDDVLAQLPQGLETDIREKGVNLSGGQKQRLALARGVFAIRESSLILLDEPTSSVDTLNEMKIFDRLFQEFPDKAIIASVHRLHLLPRFDRILVMSDGRITEQGTLRELLASGGMLAGIWDEYRKEQLYDDV